MQLSQKSKQSIKDIVLALTYRCNSRCQMCSIWQIKEHQGELPAAAYLHLPASLREVNLSGGEAVMRPDLPEIVKNIITRCARARLILSTNGFATQLIVNQVREILKIKPDLIVALSLDGVAEKHNEIRRVPDGFNKVMATYQALRQLGVQKIHFNLTLGDYNTGELPKVYALGQKIGAEFGCGLAHSSVNYFAQENTRLKKEEMIQDLEWYKQENLKGWNWKKWARAYFAAGGIYLLKTGKRLLPDYSGQTNLFIDPFGRVYPSNVSSRQIGTLSEQGFVLSDDRGAPDEASSQSWMVCTVRQAMKKHWWRVGWWMMKQRPYFFDF